MTFTRRVYRKLVSSPFSRLLLDGLGRLHLRIIPYYVHREGLFRGNHGALSVRPVAGDYECRFLDAADMASVAAMPGAQNPEEWLLTMLGDGLRCFGMLHAGRPAAVTWCDCTEARYFGVRRTLNDNEAYLTGACTHPAYRGKGIAPYIRYRMYEELAARGRNRLSSVTLYWNLPSFRFKQKLNAQINEKRLYMQLPGGKAVDAVMYRRSLPREEQS